MKSLTVLTRCASCVRHHRSAIVNIDSIVELQVISHGELEVILRVTVGVRALAEPIAPS